MTAFGTRAPAATGALSWLTSPKKLEGLRLQAFLVPIGIVFAVLFAIPLAQSFYFSVTDFNGYSTDVDFVGLENYRKIFSDPAMLAGLGFTLLYAIGTTVIVTLLAIPLAVLLNRRFFGRNVVRAVFFFPAIPSIAILGLVWGFILSPLGSGAINSLLGELGPVPWLSDSTLAQLSVIMVAVWSSTGWHAILYLAYLQSIPDDYYEAARVDGASPRQSFFSITLPLLAPAVTISSLLLMTGGLKVYDLPYTLTKGGPGYATFTITQSIIQSGIAQAKFGQASALAVVFMLVVGAIVAVQLVLSSRLEGRLS
ncbi:carbohydrate ABC transporter permease [Nonomuraea jabiensis]|uniref:Multiple sugar transport system permease protein/raffinose/stachyose/melibiose transport system permease protein n=1 Tax=Nonomuraea jabiensis TaxID=882448 RepID=A0A7W9L9D9_9ACTN|nr:sugar ABC transporter permease [Nonomuraea jabiensis]MBB5775451.1 multiple sugar transport system permease protein/raffinose/stachyose/melibiose transport system permease protein [Nonomuraea jabiensis]